MTLELWVLNVKELNELSPTQGYSIPLIPTEGRLMHLRKASVLKRQDYGTFSGVRFLPEDLDSCTVLLHPRDPHGAYSSADGRGGQMLINVVSGLLPNRGGTSCVSGMTAVHVGLPHWDDNPSEDRIMPYPFLFFKPLLMLNPKESLS